MNRRLVHLLPKLLALICGVWLAFGLSARADEAAEQKVKAAFIPHLVSFVTWPDNAFTNAAEPIRLGILGDFPLGEDFEAALLKKSVQGRQFVVAHYRKLEDSLGSHVLLVGVDDKAKLRAILAATANRPILTIGDEQGFAAQGGVINFIREDGKVRFEINPAVASAAHLKISSRLLQVARVVQP